MTVATSTVPVLIVDDNPANLKLARFALEGEGYEVRTAPDGEAALTMLSEFRPRLILMDLQLPGVDGLELTRRLKDDPATAGIVIVAVTAFAMAGDRERSRRAGCDGYLTKPIDPILLPAQVAAYLAAAAASAAPKTPPSPATAARESES